MSEILGSFSRGSRTVNTWGKYRSFGRLASEGNDYYYCCECWSGVGIRVLRRASSKITCCICKRSDVRNRLQVNEAAD